jgi:ectoine hydroxylase-related dioxygenase (phytanoyl-CoA dioxygenase family)
MIKRIKMKEYIYSIVKEKGIMVINNYYDDKYIKNITMEFDNIFNTYDNVLIHKSENLNGDKRIFNMNNLNYNNKYLKLFSTDILLCDITNLYFNDHKNSPYYNLTPIKYQHVMGNIVEYNKNQNINSGGTWHRDNHDGQIKQLLYLTDCNYDNGCLQFITNSSVGHIGKPKTIGKYNKRYTDIEIENILLQNTNCDIMNVVGNKGTLVIFDASYIHRGNVINKDMRKAITNYPNVVK